MAIEGYMLKNGVFACLLCGLLLSAPFASGLEAPDALYSKLSTRVEDYSLNADDLVHAFVAVADKCQIPMGIQWVVTPNAKQGVKLFWKSATLMQVLNDISKTQNGYIVQVRNGIVHISNSRIQSKQSFLTLKLQTFEVKNEIVGMASRKLRGIVKLTVLPPKIGPTGVGGNMFAKADEGPITLQLADSSVEDILDAFATASSKKIWIVTFVDSYIPTGTGFHRTVSLWNFHIPDDEQPIWDLFSWSDAVPSLPTDDH